MSYQRKPLSPNGFTLLEMLGVIGIIAVLAGIAVVAMKGLQRAGHDKQTKQSLSTLASMLAEYDSQTSLKKQPAYMFLPGGTSKYPPAATAPPFDIWLDADPATPKSATTGEQPLDAPPDFVDSDDDKSRLESQAVRNTAIVLREMSRIPAVKTMLSNVAPEFTMKVYEDTAKSVLIGPVLLDGWNNPIIFVPKTGLAKVKLVDGTEYIVRSNKVYTSGDPALATLAPNTRPFFASAGPDGMFSGNADVSGGDDNVYSFQN